MIIGIIGGSFKPLHRGHWGLILQASAECEKVIVLASLSDRKKASNVEIYGRDMHLVWKKFLIPKLPKNAEVRFVNSPVRLTYEILGDANESESNDCYRIYSDDDDIKKRFSEESCNKYFGMIYQRGQVEFTAVKRTGHYAVSATHAREALAQNQEKIFKEMLPEAVDRDSIWNFFKSKIK